MTDKHLPHLELAEIPEDKILNYLLNHQHPTGRHKARFFQLLGYNSENADAFKKCLMQHANEHAVKETVETSFGIKYTINGDISPPRGVKVNLRAVWFREKGSRTPRLVTVYPI